jgi:hypothetical protein
VTFGMHYILTHKGNKMNNKMMQRDHGLDLRAATCLTLKGKFVPVLFFN